MKIGYPCINLSMDCRSSRTFRLKSYSETRLTETINNNLLCLQKILEYNIDHDFFFFRITSDLIPFASHPIMRYNWQEHFKKKFQEIGSFINENTMRITMHPGQYTVLNSKNNQVFQNSIKDLEYHVEILDLMKLDKTAKVQIHVGGVYGEKEKSLKRFISRYASLSPTIKNRLVIENDDKSYNLDDCLKIHKETLIPIVFDVYHHECLNSRETLYQAFKQFNKTWIPREGCPIIHYSSEHPSKGKPSHTEHIDLTHFTNFIKQTKDFDFDMMLEIKDKERSALKAVEVLKEDPRFNNIV
jgi:UV DNA damage endonuclease